MKSQDRPESPEDSKEHLRGKIITFYSYKGGTGRSMALANVAWLLASNGYRVLTIDWDFEAPGLHRYFCPFLPDPELLNTPGLIDCFRHFVEAAQSQSGDSDGTWFRERADLMRYSASLEHEFEGGGILDFVGAGQQGASYGARVNTFQWGEFYEKLGGGIFLEAMKARLREDYHYILIDSRTGLSDTSGICTVQMPDELVVCFTLNRQSIFGAAAAATSADSQRRRSDGTQGLRIWPVPMRVELHEKDRLETARLVAREKFAPFLWHIPHGERSRFWGESEVLYFPYYAYEEVLSTIADVPRTTVSLLNSMERLASRLVLPEPQVEMPSLEPFVRRELLSRYRREFPTSPKPERGRTPRFYVSHAIADDSAALVRSLAEKLQFRFGHESLFWDEMVPLGAPWEVTLKRELDRADALIVIAGPKWGSKEWTQRELRWAMESGKPVIPLVVRDTPWHQLPDELKNRRGFKLDEGNLDQSLGDFVTQLPESFSLQSEPPSEIIDIDDPQKGRWGGKSARNGRQLEAKVRSIPNDWFEIILDVIRLEGEPLEGEVEFHLHPSFYPSTVSIPVDNQSAKLKLRAWGSFTVGALADAGLTKLELNLAELPNAPDQFKLR